MRKKPHDRQWALENVVIGRTENGDPITESDYMEIFHNCGEQRLVYHAIALDNAVIRWNPYEFEGILDCRTISIRDYAKLRRKARRASHLYTKVYLGDEYFEIDDFNLSL